MKCIKIYNVLKICDNKQTYNKLQYTVLQNSVTFNTWYYANNRGLAYIPKHVTVKLLTTKH